WKYLYKYRKIKAINSTYILLLFSFNFLFQENKPSIANIWAKDLLEKINISIYVLLSIYIIAYANSE
ncbi:hypothetical protein F4703DRAFT_1920970, partial [Phycomyces blakesleeanus]